METRVKSWMEIPERGRTKFGVARELYRRLRGERMKPSSGRSLAYTISPVDPFASAVQHVVQTTVNPNLITSFAYPNANQIADETVQMIGKSILHHDGPHLGGLVLNSGTHSLQQALHLFLTEYYHGHGWDYLADGQPHGRTDIPRPVILAPFVSKTYVEKAAMQCGLGHRNIRYYDLDENFQPDKKSIQKALENLGKNERIAVNVISAGDTEHGIVHEARKVISQVNGHQEEHGNRPFTIVDATAHWLNSWALGKKNADFSTPEVDAIAIDPQKIELPYNHSILLLKDYRILRRHVRGTLRPVESKKDADPQERVKLQSVATTFTSRGAGPVIATWAYLQNKGKQTLRKERQKLLNNADYLRELIKKSPNFQLIPSEGSVVAFEAVGDPALNRKIAEHVNNQTPYFITYSPTLNAHTQEQVQQAEQGDEQFTGLYGAVTERHTKKSLKRIFNALEQAAQHIR